MTDARIGTASRRFSWVDLLVGSGVLMVLVGLVGGLAAKRSSDIASYVASQPTQALPLDPSVPIASQIALNFDPSSAHYVPPDYTVFWFGMLVVALGLIIVATGIGVALAQRRTA